MVERASDEVADHRAGVLVGCAARHFVAHVELDHRALERTELRAAGIADISTKAVRCDLLIRGFAACFPETGLECVPRTVDHSLRADQEDGRGTQQQCNHRNLSPGNR